MFLYFGNGFGECWRKGRACGISCFGRGMGRRGKVAVW